VLPERHAATRWVERALQRARTAEGDDAPEPPGPSGPVELEGTVADCAVYDGGQRRGGRLTVPDARQAARTVRDGFVWLGLVEPTNEQIAAVAAEFELPALAVEDAVKAHQRPKLEQYGDVLFVVVKPVRYVDHVEIVEVDEVAVFLGEKFVVTVRHGDSDAVSRVRKELDHNSDLLGGGPSAVLYRLVDIVVDGYADVAAEIDVDVSDIEVQVFGGDPVDHSERIYKLKREVLQFRSAVQPLAPAVEELAANTSGTCTTTCCGSATGSTATTTCSPACCRPTWPGWRSGRTMRPPGRTRTSARSAPGPRSRCCRPRSPASTG
jgi:magnesium transporter